MRLISSILLALLLVSLPSCKFKLFGKKARLQAEMQARQDSIRVADSTRKAQDYLFALESARQDSLRRAEEERLANETKFNIIVGSFITPEFARSYADEYSRMGYKVEIIKPEASQFQFVAAEGHRNLREAVKRLTMFQDTVQVDSWIYIRQ